MAGRLSNPGTTKARLEAAVVKAPASPTGVVDIGLQFWLSWSASVVLLAVGVLVALTAGHPHASFTPDSSFDRFALFYVVAQALERFIAIFSNVIPPFGDDAASKNDRAIIVTSLTFLIGVILARTTHLLFLSAIGWNDPSNKLDVLITGLVLSGGTKALHDLIGTIQKPADTAPPAADTPRVGPAAETTEDPADGLPRS